MLEQLSDLELKNFLDISSPDYIQSLAHLKKEQVIDDFNKQIYCYTFNLDAVKLGDIFVNVGDHIRLQSFYPLYDKPFLKRNGKDENGVAKKNNYHLGLLANALLCRDIQPRQKNVLFDLSTPISSLAKKFYDNLNIDVSKPQLYYDFSKKIFDQANKKGFSFKW